MRRGFVQTARWAGAAELCALLTGCGWTARDEFLRNQTASVPARPGDGSLQSTDWKAGRGAWPEIASQTQNPK